MSTAAGPAARPRRALVLGADADLLGLLEQWLAPEGVAVSAAPGADEVGLVIAELPHPSRPQLDALRRSLPGPAAAAPLLVLSAAVFASVGCCGAAARALGADGLLPKPTTGEAVRDAVRQLLRAGPP